MFGPHETAAQSLTPLLDLDYIIGAIAKSLGSKMVEAKPFSNAPLFDPCPNERGANDGAG
jgi:hypothetical protein